MDDPLDIWPHPQWLSPDEQRTFAAWFPEIERELQPLCSAVLAAVPALCGSSPDGAAVAAQRELRSQLRAASAGQWAGYEGVVRAFALGTLAREPGLAGYYDAAAAIREHMLRRWLATLLGDPAGLLSRIGLLQKLLDRSLEVVRQEHSRAREAAIRAQRVETEQALQLSEKRFLRLAQSGLLGILICDIYGNAKDANDTFLSMLGYTREEMTSGQLRWTDLTPAEWAPLDADALEQLKARGFTRTWEKEYYHKNGSRLPILVGVAMLNDTECIAFVLDISERRRLEELRVRSAELEAQNRRIEESSRLKSEFLANMSHELRTPLNSIIGFADILYDGEVPPDSPKQREFLGHILRSGRHLLQLINDVLDLAKVEAGKLDFHPEPVDLSLIANEVIAILRSTASAKHSEVELDIEPSVSEVLLDPARLKQVLYNYVSNALKFTPEGGRVIVRARPASREMVRIEVQDTGIGIAAADLPRLFVEFQQLDAGVGKRHQGTGLGLALTRRIVEAQGGRVHVESVLGQGSTFAAELPRRAVMRAPTRPPVASLTAPEGGISVLVIEDDAADRTFLAKTLTQAGYGVETASNGAQAIAACGRRGFDAITLDLLLPDVSGLEVLHRIRKEGKNLHTPVIVVSVVAEQGVVGGFLVHDYLKKPTPTTDLIASLKRAGVAPSVRMPILVVDDDLAARNLMQSLLTQFGYRVECTDDGASALALCAQQRPLAVVLDLMMPGIDGFEFLARFRERPENRMTPVIIWTVKDLTTEDHTRLHSLAHGFIAKGQGRPAALMDELQELLRA